MRSYKTKTLGIYASDYQKGNAGQILQYSLIEVKYWIETTVASLGQLVTGKMSMKEVSGPVGIVDTVGTMINETSKIGLKEMWLSILYMAVLLSANLGVMNLLPLPALDGGRIFFLLVDAVSMALFKRKVPEKYQAAINTAGFALLMGFMLLVTFQDVFKLVK